MRTKKNKTSKKTAQTDSNSASDNHRAIMAMLEAFSEALEEKSEELQMAEPLCEENDRMSETFTELADLIRKKFLS